MPARRVRVRRHLSAFVAYAALALVFTWPLARHLDSSLTGVPGGDTGVYVWNQWVFQHELIGNHSFPYVTGTIFGGGSTANLALHNYTTFQNLVALPLRPFFDVLTTFNVVYLLMTVLTAQTVFALAWDVTDDPIAGWIGGLLFAWSPLLTTRGMGHFSLVAAAPLAMLLFVLRRAAARRSLVDAGAAGAVVWWAASTDPYYAVYCVLIVAALGMAHVVTFKRVANGPERTWRHDAPQEALEAPPGDAEVPPLTDARGVEDRVGNPDDGIRDDYRATHSRGRWFARGLDVMLAGAGILVCSMAVGGGWDVTLAGRPVHVRSLYTPVLVFTVLAVFRAGWRWRPSLVIPSRPDVLAFIRGALVAGGVAALLLSPFLVALGQRLLDDRFSFESSPVYWRSSPPGIDLLALVIPNPNHPLAPAALARWLTALPNGYLENVATIPLVALAILAAAWWTGWRPSRPWLALTVIFGLLSLGPFVRVAGMATYVPGPWALLRYVPIVGLARMPTRFAVVFMLALAVLVAGALAWLTRRWPARRAALLAATAVLLVVELLPAPRTLYNATLPDIYRRIASAPAGTRILELPFGLRDGTASLGAFSARTQLYQTAHHKPILGGYLSRVSSSRWTAFAAHPVLSTLARLSEGQALTPERRQSLATHAPALMREARVGFVVIDRTAFSDTLQRELVEALDLEFVAEDGTFSLYRPRTPG